MVAFAVPSFAFGNGFAAKTPQDVARNRAVYQALLTQGTQPKSLGTGLTAVGEAIVARLANDRANEAETAGLSQAQKEFQALQGGNDPAALATAMADPWVQENKGMAATVGALQAREMDKSDPSNQLDMAYKQAQIDALKNKPPQSLMNVGNGVVYDPNTKEWITQPSSGPGAALPAVGFTSDGSVDPVAQQDFLSKLSPDDATLVKGITSYELDPAKVLSMKGGGESERQRLITLAKQADPTYDGTQFGVRQAVRKDFTSGQSAMNLKSANTLIGHLHELLGASDALGNGNFPILNAVGNAWKSGTGSPDPVRYGLAAQASADELAKVFKGGGASDVESIKGWQSKLDPNAAPGQQKEAVTEAIKLLQSRISALRDQYQSATGKPANFTFLDGKAAKAIKDLGFEPTDIDPNYVDKSGDAPGGATTATGDQPKAAGKTKSVGGKTYVQDENGDWYEQ